MVPQSAALAGQGIPRPPDRLAVLALPPLRPWFPLVLQGKAKGMALPRAPWRVVWKPSWTQRSVQDVVCSSTYKKSYARSGPSHSALGPG